MQHECLLGVYRPRDAVCFSAGCYKIYAGEADHEEQQENEPEVPQQGVAAAGAQGRGEANTPRSADVRGRGAGRSGRGGRGRGGRRQSLPAQTQEDEAGRESSVCDRLRNATARVVRDVHRLMGDPDAIGTDGPEHQREQYLAALDEYAARQLRLCKQWMGGKVYKTDFKCVCPASCNVIKTRPGQFIQLQRVS